jgi:hypothetical protein
MKRIGILFLRKNEMQSVQELLETLNNNASAVSSRDESFGYYVAS